MAKVFQRKLTFNSRYTPNPAGNKHHKLGRSKTQISQTTTVCTLTFDTPSFNWYNEWLALNIEKLPGDVLNNFPPTKELSDNKDTSRRWQPCLSAFLKIEEYITSTPTITIDQIITRLYDDGFLVLPTAEDDIVTIDRQLEYARYFVFCALAWQTMLFTPAPLPNDWEPPRLAIVEQGGCCQYTHMALHQECSSASCNEPLSEFLMGFGVLLPSKNMCLDDDPNVQQRFHQLTEIHARTFNAYTLSAVAGIRVKWVDALACHLEFNSTTKELSLFRFPSFCQAILIRSLKGYSRGTIHACATTSSLRCQWATEAEINQLLLEVLLSYRLLFGRSRKSRSFFRSQKTVSKDNKKNILDPLLPALCAAKTPSQAIFSGLAEKETYHLPRDFPILRYRISVLQGYLSGTAPRTWLQLWRDNRDSSSWLTFWAVILFGAFGSLMAFLQVLLQFIQLATQ